MRSEKKRTGSHKKIKSQNNVKKKCVNKFKIPLESHIHSDSDFCYVVVVRYAIHVVVPLYDTSESLTINSVIKQ